MIIALAHKIVLKNYNNVNYFLVILSERSETKDPITFTKDEISPRLRQGFGGQARLATGQALRCAPVEMIYFCYSRPSCRRMGMFFTVL